MASSSSSSSSYFSLSRIHFWHYVLNEEGVPISDVYINLYLNDDPTTEARIYLTETGSSYTTSSVAEIQTDSNGFFEFWLANEWEDGGYPYTQEFRLEWYKAGIAPGVIQNINPWPNAFSWENTNIGADVSDKNKFISDFYGNKWWSHVNAVVPSASPHDIYPVDYSSGCDDNKYNKVVSNKMLYDIITWCTAEGSESLEYGGVNEHQEEVTTWTPSGDIFYKDVSHSNIIGKTTIVRLAKINDKKEIVPKRIRHLNSTATRIFMDYEVNVNVNVQGSSSSSSSTSSSSSSTT